MNISYQAAGSLLSGVRSMLVSGGPRSIEQRKERQAKCERETAFWERQKESLKNTRCDTVEEIAKKLELYHSYEDQIAAAKAAYNQEQVLHILDKAREQGEKIAEAIKKQEPKTPEERKEEMAKKALGQDQGEGILAELLDELSETVEEMSEVAGELAQEPGEPVQEPRELVQESGEIVQEPRKPAQEPGELTLEEGRGAESSIRFFI